MKRILIATATILFSTHVWAGLYLEPYLGYEVGTFKGSADVQGSGVHTADQKLTGTNFGAKLGYSLVGFAFGVDYMSGSSTGEDQETPPQADAKYKSTDLGVFAQFSLPMMLKFSATYFLAPKTEDDGTEYKGSGFKVGVGLTMFPLISINVDMININYDDAKDDNVTFNSMDVDRSGVMIGISLPLSL